MVARGEKNRSQSPCLNVRVELDNVALKAKNNSLTQTVAKLQQNNAELIKQINLLQGESFEINSKYNNLKNVISIIDSTTRTCLPKLNEVVDTFTGIIQLCSVAANISNYISFNGPQNKDSRTQAVKPQIVNGHVLLNPTITLSRLSNDNQFDSPGRSNRASNNDVRPSTSRGTPETEERNQVSTRNEEEEESDSENDEGDEPSFVSKSRRQSRRNQSDGAEVSRLRIEDFDDSDEENEEPMEEEEESEQNLSQRRLSIIHELEEEEEEILENASPRSRNRRFLQGRLQEVRIYLNQLPNTYIEQFRGSGNISISVSPPERRSSFKFRSSSVVGDANESTMDNERLYLEEQLNCSRLSQEESNFVDNSRRGQSKANLNVNMNSRAPDFFENSSSDRDTPTEQYSENISSIRNFQTPSSSDSSSTVVQEETHSVLSETLQGLDLLHIQLQHQTSTPMSPRKSGGTPPEPSDSYDSPNRKKKDSLVFKKNITKRRPSSRNKKKVAQVILNRLSLEKSPLKVVEDIVNTPVIRKSSELKRRTKNSRGKITASPERKNVEESPVGKSSQGSGSDEENVEKKGRGKAKGKGKKKKDSPTKKPRDTIVKPKISKSPAKDPGCRPKRAARPQTLKEPSLNKKMRRSK